MAGSSGFTVSRAHTGDRHYIPPARRNHLQQQQQQLLLQQQQQQRQLQQPLKSDLPAEADSRADPAGTALSKTPVRPSPSPPAPPPNLSTNLDRLMKSVTPFVPAHSMPERNWRNRQGESQSFFSLGDLWDTFKEWSVYGVGVPLLLNGKDSVMQYYVPFLSGVQLYKEPSKPSSRLRRASEKSDPESSRGPSSNGSSDCEIERWAKGAVDGTCNQQNAINLNSQKLNRISLRDNSIKSSSSDEDELLVFEYLEQEQPHHRKPLADKISALASQFPDLRTYRSCDLLPSSWLSVAWYPIYRIPVGPTLQNLDASFLTIHSLSTHFKGRGRPQVHGSSSSKKFNSMDESPKISLPVLGLASYKLKGSIMTPNGTHECQQENSLMHDADNWLSHLRVDLPDFRFFVSHNTQWR